MNTQNNVNSPCCSPWSLKSGGILGSFGLVFSAYNYPQIQDIYDKDPSTYHLANKIICIVGMTVSACTLLGSGAAYVYIKCRGRSRITPATTYIIPEHSDAVVRIAGVARLT